MNKIIHKESNDLNAEKIRFILYLAFVFLLPFDKFFSTLTLYAIILTTIIDYKSIKFTRIPKSFWIFQIPILLSLTGYLYSDFKSEGGFLIERQLAFLIFPILIPLSLSYINKKRRNAIFNAFANGTTTAIGYLLIILTSKMTNDALDLSSKSYFNHDFSAPIGIHSSYLSIYTSISIIYLQTQLIKKEAPKKILTFIKLIILCIGLLFLASRNVIITTFFITGFIFPSYYLRKKVTYIILFSVLTISVGLLVVKNVSYLSQRFTVLLIEDITINNRNDDTNQHFHLEYNEPRIKRWALSKQIIAESPIIGHGTGDEIPLLKEAYYDNNLIVSYVNELNIHNQYLSIIIKHGIIGLLFFLFFMFYNLKLSINTKDYLYLATIILIASSFITENILDSNKGIFFVSLFLTFCGYYSIKKANSKN